MVYQDFGTSSELINLTISLYMVGVELQLLGGWGRGTFDLAD
jgi:hypothetical protein